MRTLIFLSLIIVLTFTCCKKQENQGHGPSCSNEPTKYISAVVSGLKFKPGTYWVFIDSATMVIDTMKVLTASGNVIAYQYCKNNYHEVYSFQVNPKDIFSTGDRYTLEEDNMTLNQPYEDGSGYSIFVGNAPKLDSMFIYDRYYKNVEGYPKNFNSTQNGDKMVYYINTEYGFLRTDVYWGTSNLIKSQKILKDKFIVR